MRDKLQRSQVPILGVLINNLREPGAIREMERVMQTAGLIVSDLSDAR